MPTVNMLAVKCAELFWKPDLCQMEYRCISCVQCFSTHADCFWHVQRCLLLNENESEPDRRASVSETVGRVEQDVDTQNTQDQETYTESISCEVLDEEFEINVCIPKMEEDNETNDYNDGHYNETGQYNPNQSTNQSAEENYELVDIQNNSATIEIGDCQENEEFETIVEVKLKPVIQEKSWSKYAKSSEHAKHIVLKKVVEQATSETYESTNTLAKTTGLNQSQDGVSGMETICRAGLIFSRQLLRRLKDTLECDLCGNRQKHRYQMLKHMHRVHIDHSGDSVLKKYCCEICGKKMSELGNLRVHARIHTGEKPFACRFESCDRRFLTSSERTVHMRAHLGEKKFKCEQCPKSFHNKNHLNNHLRTVHSNVRPYVCEDCGRSFKLREIYKKHRLTHFEERPHHCEVCGRSFKHRSAFMVHQNIHNDNRPFKCGHCERGFHSSAARRSHEKLFHKLT